MLRSLLIRSSINRIFAEASRMLPCLQHPESLRKQNEITSKYEDIHSFVEANLIDRIGDTGKKLHTGRSRNDQVALDMKLYVRDEIVEIKALVLELMNTLHSLMKEHIHTYMPGFTHLQKAQPITLAHHFGAYMEMFKRDYGRLCDIYARITVHWAPVL